MLYHTSPLCNSFGITIAMPCDKNQNQYKKHNMKNAQQLALFLDLIFFYNFIFKDMEYHLVDHSIPTSHHHLHVVRVHCR